jgi:phosphotransferase system IIA component
MPRFNSLVNFVPDFSAHAIRIPAPASGQINRIESLPGAHHCFKYIGEGVAIQLEGQKVYSPINGRVIQVLPSFGKIVIQAKNKMRILLQLSLQHIELKGLGIKLRVKTGQIVEVGQALFELDLYKIRLQLKPVSLYFLLIDHQKFKSIEAVRRHVEAIHDPVISLLPQDKSNKQ